MEYRYLDKVSSPADVKKMSHEELLGLAQDIRNRITSVIKKGHLATNLGITEITISLHFVFDLLEDKVIFDVGHNVYPHKLLTGRHKSFETIRKKGGLSGYPNRDESPYDLFNTAHASASISTMLGVRAAFDLDKNNHKTIVVIGDGSIPGGMAMEGLNQAGHLKKDLLVILNDNEMSISPTVGAMANSLSHCRSTKFYHKTHNLAHNISRRLPSWMGRTVHKVIDGFKNMVTPGQLFRELGFKYRGPIDGHDLGLLIKTFKDLKTYNCPVLLHVLTRKGKGLDLAQKDPLGYHDGFPTTSTEPVAKKYQDVFAEELIQLANENKNIVAVTAAMATGTGISKFQESHPDKCFDVGIAEQHGISFCAGMANQGKIPFMAIYSTFLQRAIDQIFQEWSLQGTALHGVFCMDRAGLVGNDGATHGGVFDIAYLRAFPFLNLMAPKDGDELRKMLRFAAINKGIYAIRYPRGEECKIDLDKKQPIELGKSELLQSGEKIAILAYGAMNLEAIEASKILERKHGLKPTIVNMRFAKPMDSIMVKKIAETHDIIVTIEDHQLINGFGTAVAEDMIEQHLNTTSLYRLGLPDSYVQHADRAEQLALVGLDAEGISQKIKNINDTHIYA